MVKIAIIGFGVVGSGVYDVIRQNTQIITTTAGTEIDIKYILDIRDFSNHPESHLFTNDVNVIANDDDVKIVVETMGGIEPANTFARLMLSKGKSVVTSNKELVATCGDELFALAAENGCSYYFEASVGGGIPIIRPLMRCLAANKITEVSGILNGTTNYILTKMFKENSSFDDALKEAQEKGYAERNPAADVDGLDTGKKICILSSMITGSKIEYSDIPTEGIRKISESDTEFASGFGCEIKLIGNYKEAGDKRCVVVAPMLVPHSSPISPVSDVFNAVVVTGNMVGNVMFYGRGAGKLPTASAVVADVIDAAMNDGSDFVPPWKNRGKVELVREEDIECKYYLRFSTDNADALAEEIKKEFGKDTRHLVTKDEVAFICNTDKKKNVLKKAENLPGKLINILMVSD